jgi:hypothetical protein
MEWTTGISLEKTSEKTKKKNEISLDKTLEKMST